MCIHSTYLLISSDVFYCALHCKQLGSCILLFYCTLGVNIHASILQVMKLLKLIFSNSSMLSLETLLMSSNELTALPDDFFDEMPNLKVLDLSRNRFFRWVFHLSLIRYVTQNDLKCHSEVVFSMCVYICYCISKKFAAPSLRYSESQPVSF